MSEGEVYKRGDAYWIRFVTPAGDPVDRPAHTRDEAEAGQLLKTFTALTKLCRLYAVPFDPDDTLPDLVQELVAARDEVVHVFGQIRCPHCSRRFVPEWESKALEEQEKAEGGSAPVPGRGAAARARPISEEEMERAVQGIVGATQYLEEWMEKAAAGVVSGVAQGLEDRVEKMVASIVGGTAQGLGKRVEKMVANAIGPRRAKCVTKGCRDYGFAKGLCRKHYYRNYHAKRLEQERRRTDEGK